MYSWPQHGNGRIYIRHLRVPAVGGEQYRRTRTKAIHVLSRVVTIIIIIGTKQVGRELRSSEAGWILSGTDEVTVGYCLVFLHFWVQEW